LVGELFNYLLSLYKGVSVIEVDDVLGGVGLGLGFWHPNPKFAFGD